MSKRVPLGEHFEKLRSLRITPSLAAQKEPEKLPTMTEPPIVPEESSQAAIEESGSKLNTVQNSQGEELTLSNMDPVQNSPRPKRTWSKFHPVSEGEREPFTAVPHSLLRIGGHFEEPIDFMVYLHLFTFSHGFNRQTASMSYGQLEKFTGASRNTLRRSIERLSAAKWIKCVEEFEHARMSRKWRVFAPEEHGSPRGKPTGSKTDSVKNEPSADLTRTGSEIHPVTGSKTAPFIERTLKEKSKNSLSFENAWLKNYLETVKPIRKREEETRTYRELKQDYSDEQIEVCAKYLLNHGVPGSTEPCHSPMRFLSKAMSQILNRTDALRREELDRLERYETAEKRKKAQEQADELETQRWTQKETAFKKAFETLEQQEKVILEHIADFPFSPSSSAGRTLGISQWWNQWATKEKA